MTHTLLWAQRTKEIMDANVLTKSSCESPTWLAASGLVLLMSSVQPQQAAAQNLVVADGDMLSKHRFVCDSACPDDYLIDVAILDNSVQESQVDRRESSRSLAGAIDFLAEIVAFDAVSAAPEFRSALSVNRAAILLR